MTHRKETSTAPVMVGLDQQHFKSEVPGGVVSLDRPQLEQVCHCDSIGCQCVHPPCVDSVSLNGPSDDVVFFH